MQPQSSHFWVRDTLLTATSEQNGLLQGVTFLGGEAGIPQGHQSHLLQSQGGGDTIGKFRLGGVWVH
jgi:hypothetical protein